MKKLLCLLFCVGIGQFLYCNLSTTENVPSSLVEGVISAVSGDA